MHGVTTEEQHESIDPRHPHGQIEVRGRPGDAAETKHHIGASQPSEKHGFRADEHEHAQTGIADRRTQGRRGRGTSTEARDRCFLPGRVVYPLLDCGSAGHKVLLAEGRYSKMIKKMVATK